MTKLNIVKRDDKLEKQYIKEKLRQAGIAFPSANRQKHLLIIRLNIAEFSVISVRSGLKKLCSLFERIDSGWSN